MSEKSEEKANLNAKERIAEHLDDLTKAVGDALREKGICYPVHLIVGTAPATLLVVCTTHQPDPPDEQWIVVCDVVKTIMEGMFETGQLVSRDAIACASTGVNEETTNAII